MNQTGALQSFSICIPTYNRAELLDKCLDYLAGFKDLSFEVVVGDNASSDHTAQVIEKHQSRFAHFVQIRHRENIGFARNMDSILRRASRDIVYILSDDDYLFEDAMHAVLGIFNARPQVAAVAGKYLSVSRIEQRIRVTYDDGVASIIGRHQQASLLDHFTLCDGHPFIRRQVFQRFCSYWDRAIGLLPLFMKLLSVGDVIFINKPFFQHLTNGDSLSGSMGEAWMIDMANADFEIALAQSDTLNLRSRLGPAREHFLKMMYFQAARMAVNRDMFYLLWLFLKRLDAVSGAGPDLLLYAEDRFMHEILCTRVQQMVEDGEYAVLHTTYEPLSVLVVDWIKRKRPDLRIEHGDGKNNPEALVLTDHLEAGSPLLLRHSVVALQDLYQHFKLSPFPAQLAPQGQRLQPEFTDSNVRELLQMPSKQFEALCARYSQS